jgi:hypothetical protein
MPSNSPGDAAERVLALSQELPNYAERVSRLLDCSVGDVWSLYLAASGRMLYPDQKPGDPIPDGTVGETTRLSLWRDALLAVLDILGMPETRYRTGYDEEELRHAVAGFF